MDRGPESFGRRGEADELPPLRSAPMDAEEVRSFVATCAPLLIAAKYDRERAISLAYDLAVDTCAEMEIRGGEEGFATAVQTAIARRSGRSADPSRRT